MDDYPLWANIDVIVEAHASGTGAEPPHSYAFTRCITKKVLRRTHDHVLELINNGTVARGDWGNFQYKKRDFSIQDIIIYHHISSLYHCVSCVSSSCIKCIMSLVET